MNDIVPFLSQSKKLSPITFINLCSIVCSQRTNVLLSVSCSSAHFLFFFLKVSLISRIVPSPDWFVGISSYDLCSSGRWVDHVMIEVIYFIHMANICLMKGTSGTISSYMATLSFSLSQQRNKREKELIYRECAICVPSCAIMQGDGWLIHLLCGLRRLLGKSIWLWGACQINRCGNVRLWRQ
jgi:hypothetical protein